MRVAWAAFAALVVPAALARADVSETVPYPGIRHVVLSEVDPPLVAHLLVVDLTSTELRLVATAEEDRGQTTSAWAELVGAQVAVNGDLFDPFSFAPAGLAAGDSQLWDGTSDGELEGFLRFDRVGGVNHAVLVPPEDVVETLAESVEGAVGGRPMLVRAGVAETFFDCGDALAFPCEPAPRTAVGISEDGRTLTLLVVDGWQVASPGLDAAATAALLADHDVHDALAFDPGGSSTLYVAAEGGVVNSPSDGVEATVANQLGITFTDEAPGTLRGALFAGEFDGPTIAGATVTLDDGQIDVTGDPGIYSFSGLAPRYTCATATHPDYHAATGCQQVAAGEIQWNSLILYPNSQFIDAAPGTADALPVDASRAVADAETGPLDAGGDAAGDPPMPDGDGGCGCRMARRGAAFPGIPALGACLLLGFRAMLERARRSSRRVS